MGNVSIYRLDDPLPGGRCYIGASTDPVKRLASHATGRTTKSVRAWFDALASEGRQPVQTILAVVPEGEASDRERSELLSAIRAGADPLNGLTFPYQPSRPTNGDSEHSDRLDEPTPSSDGPETWEAQGESPGGSSVGSDGAPCQHGASVGPIRGAVAYFEARPTVIAKRNAILLDEWHYHAGATYAIVVLRPCEACAILKPTSSATSTA